MGVLIDGDESADAADAEDNLLLDAAALIAEVEVGGDLAVFRRVLGDVGVEEIEPDTPDIGAQIAHATLRPGRST